MLEKMFSKKILLLMCIVIMVTVVFINVGNDDYDSDVPTFTQVAATLYDDSVARIIESVKPSQTAEGLLIPYPKIEDPRIHVIEINQSLSWGFDTITGEFFLMDHFVAGKETAIFVNFTEPVRSIFKRNMTCFVSVYRNGDFLIQLDWIDFADEYTLYFQPKNIAEVGGWAPGEYTFRVYIDNEVAAERVTNFHQSAHMKILAVPVVTNYAGSIGRPIGHWMTGGQRIHSTFPVAKADVEFILGPEIDLSRYDITTNSGKYNVWRALANLQTRNQDYIAIIGFIPSPIPSDQGGHVLGYTIEPPAVIVSESDPSMLNTVIHEIAHLFAIGDEYPGGHFNFAVNAPPYRMSGRDIFTRQPVTGYRENVIGGMDLGLRESGSVIHPKQRPFHVEARTALHYVTSYMGWGVPARLGKINMWVTSDIWLHKFRTLTGIDPNSARVFTDDKLDISKNDSFGQCLGCFMDVGSDPDLYARCSRCNSFTLVKDISNGAPFTCSRTKICGVEWFVFPNVNLFVNCPNCEGLSWYPAFIEHNKHLHEAVSNDDVQRSQAVMAIEIKGLICSDDSFTPYPWYTFETYTSMLENLRSGEFGVHFFDRDDDLLSVSYFNVGFNARASTLLGDIELSWDSAPVDVVVMFPENTARIAIKRDDVELYSTVLTQTAPTVNFTGLTDNQRLENTVTLTWEATGERDLFFEIWYSPTEDEFYNIATNVTGRSLEVDLSSLPGSEWGYFYIYATDGVRTGENASPWISVPYKAPVLLTDVSDIPEFKITEEFVLDVEIYDLQDGWLWGLDEVTWTLNGTEFMSGSILWVWPYELVPGTHTFELTATNAAGMSIQHEITIRVIDDESDLPDDWSRGYIVRALSSGFAADLRRLDMPITRGDFAGFMATMYGFISEGYDPYPEYIQGIVTDSGLNNYEQFLMVYLGVMEAPNGQFEPNSTLTEMEALLIMYRVAELAAPERFGAGASDAEILEFFYDFEVVGHAEPNNFRESETLTSRLALVRLSLFYDLP